MISYGNERMNTGVKAYELGPGFIDVQFRDGKVYRYSNRKPGRVKVEEMKALAQKSQGLTTYINKYVRENYEARLR